jgi:3-dehydroquinate dehydratase-2
MRVLVVNGPNLNLLGVRRPEVYGTTTLAELEESCRAWGAALGIEVETFQSNHEGAIIDRLHDALGRCDGVVLNPGALTHYSYALHDAVEAIALPVVEVHLSDIHAREEWRSRSVVSPACAASISGHGPDGYREALEWLAGGKGQAPPR